eukprot:1583910-Amphidinium_carterae.1
MSTTATNHSSNSTNNHDDDSTTALNSNVFGECGSICPQLLVCLHTLFRQQPCKVCLQRRMMHDRMLLASSHVKDYSTRFFSWCS